MESHNVVIYHCVVWLFHYVVWLIYYVVCEYSMSPFCSLFYVIYPVILKCHPSKSPHKPVDPRPM